MNKSKRKHKKERMIRSLTLELLEDRRMLYGYDWGDAPQPYPTTSGADGASHLLNGEPLWLGFGVSPEDDGLPSRLADADVLDDGVLPRTNFIRGDNYNIVRISYTNLTGKPAIIAGWLDFNGNGDWNNDGERIAAEFVSAWSQGYMDVRFKIPASAMSGVYARFRISAQDTFPFGEAWGGEVEDYLFEIKNGPPNSGLNIFIEEEPEKKTLKVIGTKWDDVIDLKQNDQFIFVYESGSLIKSIPLSSVDVIHVDAGAGDDTVRLNSEVTQIVSLPSSLYGGYGNDTLIGGSGSDLLDGGADPNINFKEIEVLDGDAGTNQLYDNGVLQRRPTLLMMVHGAEWEEGEHLDAWTYYTEQLADRIRNLGSRTDSLVVQWSTHKDITPSIRNLSNHIRTYLDSKTEVWDLFVVGHSRGGIFVRDMVNDLVNGPIIHRKLGSVNVVMLDPTAALVVGDDSGSINPNGRRVVAKLYDDEHDFPIGIGTLSGASVAGNSDHIRVAADMRDSEVLKGWEENANFGDSIGSIVSAMMIADVTLGAVNAALIKSSNVFRENAIYHSLIPEWYFQSSHHANDLSTFVEAKPGANYFKTEIVSNRVHAGPSHVALDWMAILHTINSYHRFVFNTATNAVQNLTDYFVSLLKVLGARDLSVIQKHFDHAFRIARYFGDQPYVAFARFVGFEFDKMLETPKSASGFNDGLLTGIRNILIGGLTELLGPFKEVLPEIDLWLDENGAGLIAGLSTPFTPELVRMTGAFNADGSIALTGGVSLPAGLGTASMTGTVRKDGTYDLSGHADGVTVGGFPLSAVVVSLANSGWGISGTALLPGGVGLARLNGSVKSNGDILLTANISGRFVKGLSIPTLDLILTNSGLSVRGEVNLPAPLPRINVQGTMRNEGGFRLTGSFSGSSIMGFNFPTFNVDLSDNALKAWANVVLPQGLGTVRLSGSISTGGFSMLGSIGGKMLHNFWMPSTNVTFSSSGFSLSSSISLPPGLGDVSVVGRIHSDGKFDLNGTFGGKRLAGAKLGALRFTNSGLTVKVEIASLGAITLNFINHNGIRLEADINKKIGVFSIRSVRLDLSGSFRVEASGPGIGKFSVSGPDISKLSKALEQKLAKWKLDAPKVGGVVGQAGKAVSNAFKKAKKFNGNTAGALVFFDTNRNGNLDTFDSNQGSSNIDEPWTFTTSTGSFLNEIPEQYDVNKNGLLDDQDGQWVVKGGMLTTSGVESQFTQSSPGSWSMITPLTTIVTTLHNEFGIPVNRAKELTLLGMGIPEVDLATFDPTLQMAQQPSNSLAIYTGHAVVANLVAQLSAILQPPNAASEESVDFSYAIIKSLANKIVTTNSVVDFRSKGVLETLIADSSINAGRPITEPVRIGLAKILQSSNTLLYNLNRLPGSNEFEKVEKIKSIAQSDAVVELLRMGQGESSVEAVVGGFTGAALEAKINSVTVGPTVLVPESIDVEAEDASGATIEFEVVAVDAFGNSIDISLSHPVGSRFPLGETIVTAMATDSWGRSSSASFVVRVHDTTPPNLIVSDITLKATDAMGASFKLGSHLVSDLVDARPRVNFDASSNFFPIGLTQVIATVVDKAGNTASLPLSVRVWEPLKLAWQNPQSPMDVDADGTISPLDVLRLVNELNLNGSRPLPLEGPVSGLEWYDVNGNESIDPLDILMIINHLNSSNGLEAGEGPADTAQRNVLKKEYQTENDEQDIFPFLSASANQEFLWDIHEANTRKRRL